MFNKCFWFLRFPFSWILRGIGGILFVGIVLWYKTPVPLKFLLGGNEGYLALEYAIGFLLSTVAYLQKGFLKK